MRLTTILTFSLGLLAVCATCACASEPNALSSGGSYIDIPWGNGFEGNADVTLGARYFLSYGPDLGHVLLSPTSWTSSDWAKFGVVAGLAAAVSDNDVNIQRWVQRTRGKGSDTIARFAQPLGNGRYVFPSLGLAYCYGRIFGDEKLERASLLGIESALVSSAVTGGIKYLAHKHRPLYLAAGEDDVPWSGPAFDGEDLSFPSGHTTVSFAVATVMASEYRDHRIVPPVAYGLASLVAFSRVNDNAHWLSDVIVGAAIGHFTAEAIERVHGGNDNGRLSFAPVVDNRGAGLALSVKF